MMTQKMVRPLTRLLVAMVAARLRVVGAAATATRRCVLASAACAPQAALAGRVEEMIAERRYDLDDAASLFGEGDARGVAKAVTESAIGVDVRRKVVRGAQLADALDARWDQLSFLVNPNKVAAPPPRPPPPPVDAAFAAAMRGCGDEACAAAAGASLAAVAAEVDAAKETYRSVWEAKYPGCTRQPVSDPTAFGFSTYCAFRAYNALLPTDDRAARFEARYGASLVDALVAAGRVRRPTAAAHASPAALDACLKGCGDVLRAVEAQGLCASLRLTPPDAEDLADLARYPGWGDANAPARPAPQVQLSALLADPPELRPRLLLEGQARRLKLRVLPDVASSALRAYLLRCGVRPICEEYFVDDVYRTAFDKDDYSSIQLEVVLN